MLRIPRVLLVALLVSLCAATAAGAQTTPAPLPAGVVARVDQTPILKSDFDRRLLVVASGDGSAKTPAPGTPDYARLAPEVIRLLTNNIWIEAQAIAMGVTVTHAQVTASFREQRKASFPSRAAYERFLKQSGYTSADIMNNVRIAILSDRIRDRVIAGAKTQAGKQQRLDRFVARFNAWWKALTVCGTGFDDADACGSVVPIASA
jgi:hypothetical protein